MKILFKNKTKYSEEMYYDFLDFHNTKFGFRNSFFTLFVSMLILFCIILYIYNNYYFQAFLSIIILISFLIWKLFRPVIKIKKEINSDKFADEKVFKFIFCDNYFKIYNNLKYSKIKYLKLYKVFETDKFIYFYLDNEHALLMNKNGFYFGKKEDFSKFIRKKCWYKYKNTYQK